MQTHTLLRKWADQVYWANWQLVSCVESLTPEQQRQDMGYSIGPVSAQLAHILGVEYWWFHFLKSGELIFLRDDQYDSMESLKTTLAETEARVKGFLATVSDEQLSREVKPEFWLPETKPVSVAEAIIQVFNHSTDHRAQALYMIHQLGGKTFQQDYIFKDRPEVQD